MKLFIKPTFDNIREDLGYDEFEDVDEDAIMFQQGYDGDIMEVEDGESFEIPKGYVASIIEDEPFICSLNTSKEIGTKKKSMMTSMQVGTH